MLTRMIAADFSEAYGVPTAAVNKPGDGGPFPDTIEVADGTKSGYGPPQWNMQVGSSVMPWLSHMRATCRQPYYARWPWR